LVVAISISEGYAASLRFKRQLVPREFQNINIENYLKNERAVRFQLKCIIDDGPCDRIGKYLKVTIPELLVNQCANCDNAQRERAGKLVSHIQQNFPSDWERAVKKFQGGQLVKAEDAERLENLLGVKLDPKLVAPTTTTAAPVETTPVAKAAEVPSTSEVPISSSSAAPASSSTSSEAPAPASSSAAPEATSAASAAPVESTSVAAAVSEASSTAAAISSTSESAAVVSTSTAAAPATSTAAAAPSSSAAPVA
jgi:hypothetical protein